jgi:hypothetical protein
MSATGTVATEGLDAEDEDVEEEREEDGAMTVFGSSCWSWWCGGC